MGKIFENTLKLFNVFFCLVIAFIIKIAFFDSNSVFKELNKLNLFLCILFLITVLIFAVKLFGCLNKKTLKSISIISLLIIICFQVFFWINFKVNPSWDFGVIFFQAEKFSQGQVMFGEYFYNNYPNNIGITLALGYIFKIFSFLGGTDYLNFAILINIIIIDITVVLIYLFKNKMYGEIVSTTISMLMILITPLYTYTTIVYTDTLSMIFPLIIFYIYYIFIDNNSKGNNLAALAIGIIISLGVIIKTNVVLGLIALIIYIIFTKRNIKEILKIVITIVISFILTFNIYKIIAQRHIPIPLSEAGFPYTHWVMMGLDGNGSYNPNDVDFTQNIEGKENKKKANIQEIKTRLSKYGVSGYLQFLNGKLKYTWSDGTLFAPEKLRRSPIENNRYQNYIIGEDRDIYLYVSQSSYIVVLGLILLGAISLFKKEININYLFNIAIVGVVLFLILWETRSRYIVCFLPILILSASNGLNYILSILKKYKLTL